MTTFSPQHLKYILENRGGPEHRVLRELAAFAADLLKQRDEALKKAYTVTYKANPFAGPFAEPPTGNPFAEPPEPEGDPFAEPSVAKMVDLGLVDLHERLRRVPQIQDRHLRRADAVVRMIVLRDIESTTDTEDLEAHARTITRLLPPDVADQRPGWLARWRTLADLLSTRAESIALRDPERILAEPTVAKVHAHLQRYPNSSMVDIAEVLDIPLETVERAVWRLKGHGVQ